LLRLVGFDLDDTLWDETRAQNAAMAELHAAWQLAEPIDAFYRRWRSVSSRHFDAYTRGELTIDGQRRRRIADIRAAFALATTEADLDAWTARYRELYEAHWQPYPDAAAVLARVRALGLRTGLITNGDGVQQRRKLERMGLVDGLDWIVISGEVGAAKPDRRVFDRLLEVSGVAPDEVLFVGDRRDRDVEPARAAGMTALLVDHRREATGDDVVCSLAEVLARVEALVRSPDPR